MVMEGLDVVGAIDGTVGVKGGVVETALGMGIGGAEVSDAGVDYTEALSKARPTL